MTPGQRNIPPINYNSMTPFLLPQMPEDAVIAGPSQPGVNSADWTMLQGMPCNEPAMPCPSTQPVYTSSSGLINHFPTTIRPREDSVSGINHKNIQTSPTSDAIGSGSLIKYFYACIKNYIKKSLTNMLHRHTNPGPFQCLWPGCTHVGPFLRESTLLRHIKTMHISPGAYKCSICAYANGRKDKVHEHVRLVHKR